MILGLAFMISGCLTVDTERIFAADLAKVAPIFAAIPQDRILGYSPAPGTRRVVDTLELVRFATPYRIAIPEGTQLCFERKMQKLDEAAIRAAILESLPTKEAHVEVLAISDATSPEGMISFPVNGLSVSAAVDPTTPILWRGYVTYDKSKRFALWARVRISAQLTRVVAVRALTPGDAIKPDQVRLETYEGFPLRSEIARRLDEVVGRALIRTAREGSALLRSDLTEPLLVRRGESVTVSVVSGGAQIQLEATAENQGRQGDLVSLRNPSSGKLFRARVEGKDKAILVAR
jgi:flagella basal body P-ring formation protein FlgA